MVIVPGQTTKERTRGANPSGIAFQPLPHVVYARPPDSTVLSFNAELAHAPLSCDAHGLLIVPLADKSGMP
jgi:hypothetical protein